MEGQNSGVVPDGGVRSDRGHEVPPPLVFRARFGDVLGTITLAGLIGVVGFAYNIVRNVGADSRAEVRAAEERSIQRDNDLRNLFGSWLTRLESKLDRLSEGRKE